MRFRNIFNQEIPDRDKYLSRVLGIFSEEIARLWLQSGRSPYINLGRPTVYLKEAGGKGYTMDFTLQKKEGKKETYIAEMKCELEYDGYKYLELKECGQLDHHKGEAFRQFLSFARNPEQYRVTVGGNTVKPAAVGSVLIWGAVTEEGIRNVMERARLYDVLSLEKMVGHLLEDKGGKENGFQALLNKYREWTQYLFKQLGTLPSQKNIGEKKENTPDEVGALGIK